MCPAVLGIPEAEAVEVEGETGTLGVTLQKYVVISILLFISLKMCLHGASPSPTALVSGPVS